MDDIKKLKKNNEITEDDQKTGEKKLQDITELKEKSNGGFR